MTGTRHDISTRADIERLVDTFYARVRADAVLGPIFDDVARTDWAHHLPRMYDFWETVLFGVAAFRGNPITIHLDLAARAPLGEHEFRRWLALFEANVDETFAGAQAEEAKRRASRIATLMQHHIRNARPGAAAGPVSEGSAC